MDFSYECHFCVQNAPTHQWKDCGLFVGDLFESETTHSACKFKVMCVEIKQTLSLGPDFFHSSVSSPSDFYVGFNFLDTLHWLPRWESTVSQFMLNSLWTCCVLNNWLEVWSSPSGSWSNRRYVPITLHHFISNYWYIFQWWSFVTSLYFCNES